MSAERALLGAASAAAGSHGSPQTTPHALRCARQLGGGSCAGKGRALARPPCARPTSRDARPVRHWAPPPRDKARDGGAKSAAGRALPRRCAPPALRRAARGAVPAAPPGRACPACIPATPPTAELLLSLQCPRPDAGCSGTVTAASPGSRGTVTSVPPALSTFPPGRGGAPPRPSALPSIARAPPSLPSRALCRPPGPQSTRSWVPGRWAARPLALQLWEEISPRPPAPLALICLISFPS